MTYFRQTHLLLDLDNTLFFTSHCERQHKCRRSMFTKTLDLDAAQQKLANQLQNRLIACWTKVTGSPYKARISIVTNGTHDWLMHVLQHFLPKLYTIILFQRAWDKRHKTRFPTIDLVSAQTRYKDRFPDDHVAWKYYAFLDQLYDPYFSSPHRLASGKTQILLFADGPVDPAAFRKVMKIFSSNGKFTYKLVTFADDPSLKQLRDEWNHVSRHLDEWLQDRRSFQKIVVC